MTRVNIGSYMSPVTPTNRVIEPQSPLSAADTRVFGPESTINRKLGQGVVTCHSECLGATGLFDEPETPRGPAGNPRESHPQDPPTRIPSSKQAISIPLVDTSTKSFTLSGHPLDPPTRIPIIFPAINQIPYNSKAFT